MVLPCKCCCSRTNDFVPINQYPDYSGIYIEVNRQGTLRVRTYPPDGIDGNFETQDTVQMDYCPLCGRKFTDD